MRTRQEISLIDKSDLHDGSLLLSEFAKMCGIKPHYALSQRSIGLSYRRVYGTHNCYEYLDTMAVLEGARVQFYLTPNQQAEALAYWTRHRVKHHRPRQLIQK
jgi:hypothetical protein